VLEVQLVLVLLVIKTQTAYLAVLLLQKVQKKSKTSVVEREKVIGYLQTLYMVFIVQLYVL